ncbi:hypothetical protein [Paenibacillus arenilitoris]|uniref:Uncharacterized protein n=1 Tax=Paenibacillus arenilitoris TaxID=2772299 RepID=A0A927CPZ2_9BACL|nr:hypothetical protein [Paenibacillus arenilitoris]MBD2870952.1 hypothetical protein [Paenibacillus arenilitoris]
MTVGQMLRSLAAGLLIGIFALGLLPFLIVLNGMELLGLAELEASPLYMLLGSVTGRFKAMTGGKSAREPDDDAGGGS